MESKLGYRVSREIKERGKRERGGREEGRQKEDIRVRSLERNKL